MLNISCHSSIGFEWLHNFAINEKDDYIPPNKYSIILDHCDFFLYDKIRDLILLRQKYVELKKLKDNIQWISGDWENKKRVANQTYKVIYDNLCKESDSKRIQLEAKLKELKEKYPTDAIKLYDESEDEYREFFEASDKCEKAYNDFENAYNEYLEEREVYKEMKRKYRTVKIQYNNLVNICTNLHNIKLSYKWIQ